MEVATLACGRNGQVADAVVVVVAAAEMVEQVGPSACSRKNCSCHTLDLHAVAAAASTAAEGVGAIVRVVAAGGASAGVAEAGAVWKRSAAAWRRRRTAADAEVAV